MAKKKSWTRNNSDKWMRYEDDIQEYYLKSLEEWIGNPDRKPSTIAFTSGLGRFIARMCERYGKKEASTDRLSPRIKTRSVREGRNG